MFSLKLREGAVLEQVTEETGRYYVEEYGEKFFSVTTILKNSLRNERLEAWKKLVGKDVAEEYARKGAIRGTEVHLASERFILGEDNPERDLNSFYHKNFHSLKKILLENITDVYGVELRALSRELKAAGTIDLYCKWKGRRTIVDFKTSNNPKTENMIPHYFIQACAYGYMIREMYWESVEKIVIILIPDFDEIQIFEKDIEEYYPMMKEIFINETDSQR